MAGRRSRAFLPLLCAAQFMLLVDDTIVNVALPTIRGELHFSEASLSWVVDAYFLTFGGLLLVGGRAADILGGRRVFIAGLTLFAVASLGSGIAPTSAALVVARGVQGVGGAMLSPAALSLVLAAYRRPEERNRALGIWAALTGVGAMTGLLAGGALVTWVGWRWIFLINLPVAITTIALTLRVLPVAPSPRTRPSPGMAGAALVTAALLCLVYTVVETDRHPWGSLRNLVGLAAAFGLAVGFAANQRRARTPLIPRGVAQLPGVIKANGMMLVGAAGLFGMFFFLTLYMQSVRSWSPLRTGISFLPFSLAFGAASVLVSRGLAEKLTRPLLMAGSLLASVGLWRLSALAVDSSYTVLLIDLVLMGTALGLLFVPLVTVATGGWTEHDTGLASGLMTTCQQVGAAVGIAVLVTLASHVTTRHLTSGTPGPRALVDGFASAFRVQAILFLLAGLVGLTIRTNVRSTSPRTH